MTESVLVTGGTGFVAGWCIVELLERGYAVRTTIRNPAKETAVRKATGGGDRLTFALAGPTTLTTILPTAIFGPLLPAQNAGSVEVIARLLTGRLPFVPHFGFTVVDVRDLADLHIRAMTSPAAAGQRFIGAGEFMWLSEIARTLRS